MTTQTEATPAGPVRELVGADGVRSDGTPILRISVCRRCASRWFPPRDTCSACAHDELDSVEAGTDGIAYASTVVRIGAPGFATPYVLSYVDVDGVRVLTHTDTPDLEEPEALSPGTPVTFSAGPIGTSGETELWSYRVRASTSEGDR